MLKGLTPQWELKIIGKKAKVYELECGDIVLHMGELFCKPTSFPDREDMQLPASALAAKYGLNRKGFKSFVYADAWCHWYDLNQGYILVKGLRQCFNDIYGINVGVLQDKLYQQIRALSLKDYRFLKLGLYGCEGADSAAYHRMCADIVNHYFIKARDRK